MTNDYWAWALARLEFVMCSVRRKITHALIGEYEIKWQMLKF
jgi:hypothetical protein